MKETTYQRLKRELQEERQKHFNDVRTLVLGGKYSNNPDISFMEYHEVVMRFKEIEFRTKWIEAILAPPVPGPYMYSHEAGGLVPAPKEIKWKTGL